MSQTPMGLVSPDTTSEYYYPRSKRKVVKDGKGNIIYDSDKDKDKK
jgi:hypothetical protein